MKIGVFGGTRGVGKEFVKLALADGHIVTLLARSVPEKSEYTDKFADNLIIIQGNALDKVSVDKFVQGQEVIFNALGGILKGKPEDIKICSLSAPIITEALIKHKVPKQVVITSSGCGDSWAGIPFLLKPMLYFFIGEALRDKNIQEQIIASTKEVEYIVVRPGGLKDGEPNGDYEIGQNGKTIARGNVALFAYKQIVEESKYWNQFVLLSGK